MPDAAAQAAVEAAITSRRSIRAFLPKPVPQAEVAHLLDVAARAPSGSNIQPWKVYAQSGAALKRLCDALMAEHEAGITPESEYQYYPRKFFEPFHSRRRKVGWDLYGLLGIGKGDAERMRAQHGRNLIFFDAPVGLIFTIHRDLEQGSWLDYGMFLQNVMVAARGMGLDTCPQAAFMPYHRTIQTMLEIPPEEMLVCGMALGYADPAAVENSLETERAPAQEFTRFAGWAE
jgi:nitroreductase